MRTLLVTLVVLLLLAVGADRVAEKVATDRAESRLAAEGLRDPQVEAGGFPFLLQLLDRRFDDVHVTAAALDGTGRPRPRPRGHRHVGRLAGGRHGHRRLGPCRRAGDVRRGAPPRRR